MILLLVQDSCIAIQLLIMADMLIVMHVATTALPTFSDHLTLSFFEAFAFLYCQFLVSPLIPMLPPLVFLLEFIARTMRYRPMCQALNSSARHGSPRALLSNSPIVLALSYPFSCDARWLRMCQTFFHTHLSLPRACPPLPARFVSRLSLHSAPP